MSARTGQDRTAVLETIRTTVSAVLATDDAWPRRTATLLSAAGASWRECADVCADLAWAARTQGRSALLALTAEQATQDSGDVVYDRALRHLYLVSLRYDLRCADINATFHALRDGQLHETDEEADGYTLALVVFAILGKSDPEGLKLADLLLECHADHVKSVHAVLHGLWLGVDLPRPDREQRMLDLFLRLPEDDPVAAWRAASALRSLGAHDKALLAIDYALEVLPPGDTALHADLVRERLLITAARDRSTVPPSSAPGARS